MGFRLIVRLLKRHFRRTGPVGEKLQALLRSRRFYFAVAGVVTVVANDALGFDFSQEAVTGVLVMLSVWIFADSKRETV